MLRVAGAISPETSVGPAAAARRPVHNADGAALIGSGLESRWT